MRRHFQKFLYIEFVPAAGSSTARGMTLPAAKIINPLVHNINKKFQHFGSAGPIFSHASTAESPKNANKSSKQQHQTKRP